MKRKKISTAIIVMILCTLVIMSINKLSQKVFLVNEDNNWEEPESINEENVIYLMETEKGIEDELESEVMSGDGTVIQEETDDKEEKDISSEAIRLGGFPYYDDSDEAKELEMMFEIKDYYFTNILPEGIEDVENIWMTKNEVDENGNILDDYMYLLVEVELENINDIEFDVYMNGLELKYLSEGYEAGWSELRYFNRIDGSRSERESDVYRFKPYEKQNFQLLYVCNKEEMELFDTTLYANYRGANWSDENMIYFHLDEERVR